MAQQTLNLPREQTHQRIADALEDIVDKIVDTSSADNIDYDNTTSGLSANKVQSAIDELALAGFVTNTVNNLVNYYLKSETYNKTEVDSLINAVKNSRFEAVSTLPTTNIKTNVIYLVPKSPTQTNNAKDEYINLDGTSSGWEKIGDTEVDLSGYVTTTALNTALSNYTTTANLTKLLDDKVDKVSGKGLSTNDYTTADKNKLTGIEAEANKTVVDSAMSDSSTNPLQNKVITKELEGAKTLTGNPITVTDAAPVNAVNLSMNLEPIQDLHGYDHPWVGGAGKNKFNKNDLTGYGWISGNDGIYVPDSDFITSNFINISSFIGGKITLNKRPYGTNPGIAFYDSNKNYVSGFANNGATQGTPWTITVPNGAVYVRVCSAKTYLDELQLEEGTTATSYSPYSNICPISGRDEYNVSDVGANLIDITSMTPTYDLNGITYTINSDGSVTANGTATARSQVYWGIPQNTAKTLANKKLSGGSSQSGCSLFLELNESPFTNYATDTGEGATISSDIANATTTVNCIFRIAQGTTVNNLTITPRITDKMKTYTIQLGDTVYGGTLDVTRGKMVVDTSEVDLGDVTWEGKNTVGNGSLFYSNTSPLANIKNYYDALTVPNIYCSIFKPESMSNVNLGINQGISIGPDSSRIRIYTESNILKDLSLNDFKTAVTGQKLVYELAEPYTIQLTPQQIKLLENTNTIYTDYEGDTITIEYQPNNAIGEAVRVVEESYDAIIQNLLERIEALENNE